MTEDKFKAAVEAYEAAYYSESGAHSRWLVLEKMRAALVAPYKALFNECFDFSCGTGWWQPLEQAFKELLEAQAKYPNFPIRVVQVKEKFGSLRLYTRVSHCDEDSDAYGDEIKNPVPKELLEEIRAITGLAERECGARCEVCGEPGQSGGDSWIKTLCDKHAKMRS